MAASPLPRLRRLCLALPEAQEIETWDTPTFRIHGRIFALVGARADRPAVWLKAPRGSQELLVAVDPERFFRPPYLGHKGWIGVVLTGLVDWEELDSMIRRSFSLVAPKRVAALIATVPEDNPPKPGDRQRANGQSAAPSCRPAATRSRAPARPRR